MNGPPGHPLSIAIYMHDLSGGGVERQNLALTQMFQSYGLDVTLLLHRMVGELVGIVPPGVRIIDLKSSRTLRDIFPIAQFLRNRRPDILLSNLDHNNIAAMLAKLVSCTRTKVVICQHNSLSTQSYQEQNWSNQCVPFCYRLLHPVISHAVAVSDGVGKDLRRVAGIPQQKISVIHNPVIGEDFAFRAKQPVRHPWLDDRKGPVFVTAGRLVPVKDFPTMLRALALHRQRRESRLLVLGEGPLRQDLERQAQDLGLADAVGFLGFQPNPLPFFRSADAFVLSSSSEGFGNVMVEAMGCGTPVIATDCDYGPAEILDEGRYGILVPPRDPHRLAAAMDEVDTLAARWPSDALQARAAAFTYGACADSYMSLFRSLVPPAGAARGPIHTA